MATYNALTPEIIEQIRAAANGHIYTGEDINEDYARDEMPIYGKKMPDLVVQPLTTEEVAGVMKICNENLIPVTPRGAGTGLVGAAVPVLIGLALAYIDSLEYGDVFSWTAAILCMLFALIMQIDANFINDFFDFTNGTDDVETRLGPRRACAQGWVTLDMMKKAIAITTCLACVIGLPLAWYGGLEMILVGILCVVFAFLYTTFFSYQGLGDILVLLFFGIVPVCCTYYVQLHTLTWEVFLASVACGLVIDALLIVNNFRDRDNDQQVGKKTLIVHLGPGL